LTIHAVKAWKLRISTNHCSKINKFCSKPYDLQLRVTHYIVELFYCLIHSYTTSIVKTDFSNFYAGYSLRDMN